MVCVISAAGTAPAAVGSALAAVGSALLPLAPHCCRWLRTVAAGSAVRTDPIYSLLYNWFKIAFFNSDLLIFAPESIKIAVIASISIVIIGILHKRSKRLLCKMIQDRTF